MFARIHSRLFHLLFAAAMTFMVPWVANADPASTVQSAYENGFGRAPDPGELYYWGGRVADGSANYDTIIAAIKASFPNHLVNQDLAISNAYARGFGRAPESWERDNWRSGLQGGGLIHNDILNAIRGSFPNHPEAQEFTIYAAYKQGFGRSPFEWEVAGWMNGLQGGTLIYNDIVNAIRSSFPNHLENQDIAITAAYFDGFGRAPFPSERDGWRYGLQGGGLIYQDIMNAIRSSYPNHTLNQDTAINAVYQKMFWRSPDAGEIAYWRGRLNGGAMTFEDMRIEIARTLSVPQLVEVQLRYSLSTPFNKPYSDQWRRAFTGTDYANNQILGATYSFMKALLGRTQDKAYAKTLANGAVSCFSAITQYNAPLVTQYQHRQISFEQWQTLTYDFAIKTIAAWMAAHPPPGQSWMYTITANGQTPIVLVNATGMYGNQTLVPNLADFIRIADLHINDQLRIAANTAAFEATNLVGTANERFFFDMGSIDYDINDMDFYY
ncbi:DUF4214 domain-containing protein [Corallococcus coralloides]|nr:DUF4214 domain-containing protein [Corallococcus coralloides]